MALILGLESSCDDSAVALVDSDRQILAQAVVGQNEAHRPFGGVVPEIAARAHVDILPGLIRQVLHEADVSIGEVDAIAATAGPGLIGGVMVALMAGKGLALSAGRGTLHYIPGCAAMTPALRARLSGAACVLFDGTLFDDEEMIRLGAGPKTGRRMGHMPMTGAGSTLEAFAGIPVRRRVFVHINNTNPALLADSPERAHLAAAGWEVAEDGMEIRL